ncbi:hypothetical protein DVR12_19710 [Chitinophaga silvatica]|uniref:Transposase IS200-like domain-containing protein n=1 Tax=Chitinophaga silvatica TaxID=2282649 RepID=A0A3E1Y5E5_9BACT|nr:transposase [Chitinophaga silvatica]RFS19959.1 hypothetical protein DVR12_19710 [Chitinophaga silvatica]
MTFNPMMHDRKSIRLRDYDYSDEACYFITICCHDKLNRFGTVRDDRMCLNQLGIFAHSQWSQLPYRFENISLGAFQVMPNHIHGIICIEAKQSFSLGIIIGAYKSLVLNSILKYYKSQNITLGQLWQRNYYEHIIRDQKSYESITDYIIRNPETWSKDTYYSK